MHQQVPWFGSEPPAGSSSAPQGLVQLQSGACEEWGPPGGPGFSAKEGGPGSGGWPLPPQREALVPGWERWDGTEASPELLSMSKRPLWEPSSL